MDSKCPKQEGSPVCSETNQECLLCLCFQQATLGGISDAHFQRNVRDASQEAVNPCYAQPLQVPQRFPHRSTHEVAEYHPWHLTRPITAVTTPFSPCLQRLGSISQTQEGSELIRPGNCVTPGWRGHVFSGPQNEHSFVRRFFPLRKRHC